MKKIQLYFTKWFLLFLLQRGGSVTVYKCFWRLYKNCLHKMIHMVLRDGPSEVIVHRLPLPGSRKGKKKKKWHFQSWKQCFHDRKTIKEKSRCLKQCVFVCEITWSSHVRSILDCSDTCWAWCTGPHSGRAMNTQLKTRAHRNSWLKTTAC